MSFGRSSIHAWNSTPVLTHFAKASTILLQECLTWQKSTFDKWEARIRMSSIRFPYGASLAALWVNAWITIIKSPSKITSSTPILDANCTAHLHAIALTSAIGLGGGIRLAIAIITSPCPLWMTTPMLAEWELLKIALSKFALKPREFEGHQKFGGVAILHTDRASWALMKSCSSFAACVTILSNNGDGRPSLRLFHRFHGPHAMQMKNSALLSSDTYKNLDNRSMKSTGGEETAWQNQAWSLHTFSTSRQPKMICKGSSTAALQMLHRSNSTMWCRTKLSIVGRALLEAL